MHNTFVIDRARYEYIETNKVKYGAYGSGNYGIYGITLQHLDFYIIEELDGGATFIKNKNGFTGKYTKKEYEKFKLNFGISSATSKI